MTWQPVNDGDWNGSNFALPGAVAVLLSESVQTALEIGKCGSWGYVPGPTSDATSGDPTTETADGFTTQVQGVDAVNPDTAGLRVSTGIYPLSLPPLQWPLSARCVELRVTVALRVEEADVDCYAFALVDGAPSPAPPAVVTDDEGTQSFAPAVTASTSYARIGPGDMPVADACYRMVELVIPVPETPTDHGYHGAGDAVRSCAVYLCLLSRVGERDTSWANIEGVPTIHNDGRVLESAGHFSVVGVNPGPAHKWIRLVGVDLAAVGSAAYSPCYRHVQQVRPADVTSGHPESHGTLLVIAPPIDLSSVYWDNAEFEVYTCGIATVFAVTVEESDFT